MILLLSNSIGDGDERLGEGLLETYLALLKQEKERPDIIFCMNKAVLTLTDDSFHTTHLKDLEEAGVTILACKTCTDYYEVTDKIKVGELSTMKDMIQLSHQHKTITIS